MFTPIQNLPEPGVFCFSCLKMRRSLHRHLHWVYMHASKRGSKQRARNKHIHPNCICTQTSMGQNCNYKRLVQRIEVFFREPWKGKKKEKGKFSFRLVYLRSIPLFCTFFFLYRSSSVNFFSWARNPKKKK